MPYKDPEKQKAYLKQYAQQPEHREGRKAVNHRYYAKKRYGSEKAFLRQKYDRIFAAHRLAFEYLEKERAIKRKRRSFGTRWKRRLNPLPTATRARRSKSNHIYYIKKRYGSFYNYMLVCQERAAERAKKRLPVYLNASLN